MSNSDDYDSWDAAERFLEAVTATSALITLKRPNKVTTALTVIGLVGRIFCALIEPPKCPKCDKRMGKDASNQYHVCKFCGLIKRLG